MKCADKSTCLHYLHNFDFGKSDHISAFVQHGARSPRLFDHVLNIWWIPMAEQVMEHTRRIGRESFNNDMFITVGPLKY